MGEKFYITTAIAYTSRKPHIGNTYEIVLTDAIATQDEAKIKASISQAKAIIAAASQPTTTTPVAPAPEQNQTTEPDNGSGEENGGNTDGGTSSEDNGQQ